MQRRWVVNSVSTFLALVVGLFTVYLSYTKLKEPQIALDWAALVFSGLTTAIITFFVTWGHFQKDPAPEKREAESKAE